MEEKSPAKLPPSDAALVAQYWDGMRRQDYLEPERYLMLAVLRDALLDYTKNVSTRNQRFRSARSWFFNEQSDRLFSFETICEMLNLDPAYIRSRLQAGDTADSAQH